MRNFHDCASLPCMLQVLFVSTHRPSQYATIFPHYKFLRGAAFASFSSSESFISTRRDRCWNCDWGRGGLWRARGAWAYNEGLRALPPAGSRGIAPDGNQGLCPWSWKALLFVCTPVQIRPIVATNLPSFRRFTNSNAKVRAAMACETNI